MDFAAAAQAVAAAVSEGDPVKAFAQGVADDLSQTSNDMFAAVGQMNDLQNALSFALESNTRFSFDNYNITLHEFAHILDNSDDRVAQSVPVPVLSPDRKTWEEMVDREYTPYGEEKRRAEFSPVPPKLF